MLVIKIKNKIYKVKDDRLSPMSYVKLKELGYTSDDWQGKSQEWANNITQNGVKKQGTKTEKTVKSTSGKSGTSNVVNTPTPVEKWNKLVQSEEAKTVFDNIKNKKYYTVEQLEKSNFVRQMDNAINEYIEKHGYSYLDNSPKMQKVREDAYNTLIKRGAYNPKTDKYDGQVKKQRKAVIAIGLPASGKSSKIVNTVSPEIGGYVIDSDEAKFLFPQFKESNGIAADSIHKDSQDVIGKVFQTLMSSGTNMVIPVIGSDYQKLFNKWIKPLEDSGYDVEIQYQPANPEKSLNRVVYRAIKVNRPIRSSVVFSYGNKPEDVYKQLINKKNKFGKNFIRKQIN